MRKVGLWNRVPIQLGLGVLLVTWAALALSFLLFERKQEQQFTEQHVSTARKVSLIIASNIAQRMLAGGGREVWNAISSEAAQHRDLADAFNIRVFTGSGTVKAASDSDAIGTHVELRGNPDCPRCDSTRPGDFPALATVTAADGTSWLRVVNAVPVSQACMRCHDAKNPPRGFVSMDYDLTPLQREASQRRVDLLVTGIAAGVLVMALTALLFRLLVMRSVAAIAYSADRLAEGNLAARAKVVGKNELALLARNFNHMAQRIEEQVAHIESAHTVSDLLYTLVVEASKNLETSEIASGVWGVLLQKLRPQHAAFFLENAVGGWACSAGRVGQEEKMASGEGVLEEVLAGGAEQLQPLLGGMSVQVIADACRKKKLQLMRERNGLNLVLPVVAETRLVGLLVCMGVPSRIQVGEDLIENLQVHLTLAAVNSRNYTGAITDGLTRLKNKRYGLIRLEEAVYSATRYKSGLGLSICDIDHFKRVNDSYGHTAGDAAIKEVARRIAACVRKADIAARYGGEEFMLILPEADPNLLAAIGEKIRRTVSATPVHLDAVRGSLPLTISVGIAAYRAEGDSGEALIARADAALYRAKRGGRNRVELHH